MEGLNPTAAAVLASLRGGPNSGWGVARNLEAVVGAFWNVTQSQVYRELGALADAGLVEAGAERGPRARREYRITARGKAAFKRWLNEPPGPDVVRIPFLLKLSLAGEQLSDDTLREFVDAQRPQHEACLAGYLALLPDLEAQPGRQALLVRYGILHEQAVLSWLDAVSTSVATRAR